MVISRSIPNEVRRFLRREAHFGCANCGSPILQYHHIVPFARKPHHNPDDMIALCPTCHQSLGKMRPQRCYELKANPYNKRIGKVRGELATDRDTTAFMVGSCIYIDTPIVFSFFNKPIIQYRIDQGQATLDIYIPNEKMWPDILVDSNDLIVNTHNKWDVEFRTNFLRVQKTQQDVYFQIDLRKEVAEIEGRFTILGETYVFSPSSTNIAGFFLRGAQIRGCGTGLSVGDGRRTLHWPNYAMSVPEAVFA